MRSACSLYVDAGYLLASAATRVTGTSLRNGIHVEYAPLIEGLIRQAETISDLPLLRLHWYDSAKNGIPDAQQERIGELPKVKLRLGRFGVDGQQKGVDLRIGLDLVAHARNKTADVFFLVSGDDDLTEAVEEAQVHGVQVVVLAVPNAENKPHGLSRHLMRAADETDILTPETLDSAIMKVAATLVVPKPAPPPVTPVVQISERVSTNNSRVTPLDIAAVRVAGSAPTPVLAAPAPPALAYSSTTGGERLIMPDYLDQEEAEACIDSVVTNVLKSFRSSGTDDDLERLGADRPSIPREIDRALLLDLSETLGVYDLNDRIRFRLRQRFWEKYDDAE